MERVTVNSLLREARRQWPGGLSERQYSILNVMAHCRTGVLGRSVERCEGCGHREVLPASCGNRHCPLCLGGRQAAWAEQVAARLPKVPHFHVVFTLPAAVAAIMEERPNFRSVGDAMFRAVNRTLKTFMGNNLKSEGGWIGVMHTWGGTLSWHPHIHTIVSAGGFSREGGRWRKFRPDYLFPVRALSKVFRAIMLEELASATASNAIAWPDELADPKVRRQWMASQRARDWVVYAEPTLKRTHALVRYLARYTCRSAIGNRRLRRIDHEAATVSFTYRNHRAGGRESEMTLALREFVRRFAAHIAPRGFRRIRYYGFLARRSANPPASKPAQRHCVRCKGTNWTRKRFSAKMIERLTTTATHAPDASRSRQESSSFSLHTGTDPPTSPTSACRPTPAVINTDFHLLLRRG